MRTTIPWGDGTGDNIYLDYNASAGDQSVAVSSDANAGVARTKVVTFSASGATPVTLTVNQAGIPTPIEDLTARINFSNSSVCVTDIVPSVGDWYKIKVAAFSNALHIFMGYRNRSNSDNDSISIEMDKTGLNYYALRCKMYGTRYTSSSALATNSRYVIEAKPTGVTCDPSVGTYTTSTYTFANPGVIALGAYHYANGTNGYANGQIDIFGLEIYGSDNQLKHRLIPQPDKTFLDEVTNVAYTCKGNVTYADDN